MITTDGCHPCLLYHSWLIAIIAGIIKIINRVSYAKSFFLNPGPVRSKVCCRLETSRYSSTIIVDILSFFRLFITLLNFHRWGPIRGKAVTFILEYGIFILLSIWKITRLNELCRYVFIAVIGKQICLVEIFRFQSNLMICVNMLWCRRPR